MPSHAIISRGSPPPRRGSHDRANWMVLIFIAALWQFAMGVCPLSGQQKVTVRFLDPKSGTPICKMWVGVTQYKGNLPNGPKGPIPVEYVLAHFNAQTNENGEVAVTLHDPIPTFIQIQSFDLWNSGPRIPTSEVLGSGVVLTYSRRAKRSEVKPAPRPGEIVFVERRLTRWDRMRMELP